MEENLVKEKQVSEQHIQIQMHSLLCSNCGITYSIPNILVKLWEKEQKLFMCPNGHSVRIINHSHFSNDSVQEQLKSANLKIAELTAEIEKLKLELEIWKPASMEESV